VDHDHGSHKKRANCVILSYFQMKISILILVMKLFIKLTSIE